MNTISEIYGCGSYLPKNFITNDELAEIIDTSDEWITTRTGIKQRHVAEKSEMTSDLACEAAKNALEDAKIKARDVDLVIVGTTTPDDTFPATAVKVQKHLELKGGAAFDIQAACSGFIYALSIANNMLRTKQIDTALVVGADTLTKLLDWNDRTTYPLFGDGAGAVLVEPSDRGGIIDSIMKIDGTGGDFLYMPGGGSLNPTTNETFNKKMHFVKQNGATVFKSAVKGMYDITKKIMDRNGINNENLKLFIAHQANKRIIDATAKKMDLRKEQVLINIDKYANTTAASIPIAISDAYNNKMLSKGDNVILTAFGAGFTWGSCLINWGINE